MTTEYPSIEKINTSDPCGLEGVDLLAIDSPKPVRVFYASTTLGRTLVVSIFVAQSNVEKAFFPEGERMSVDQAVGLILAGFIEHFEDGQLEYHSHSVCDSSTSALEQAKDKTISGMRQFITRDIQIVFRKAKRTL